MSKWILHIHFVTEDNADAALLHSSVEEWLDGVDEPIPVGGAHDFAVVLTKEEE